MRRRAMDVKTVLKELEALHQSLEAGDSFPSRRELIERLNASEHTVRLALAEFERRGKIIRRVGRGGSVVAGVAGHGSGLTNGASVDATLAPVMPAMQAATQSRTLVTISDPDGSIFDRALQLLVRHPDAATLTVNCRLMKPEDAQEFVLPSASESPLGYIVFSRRFAPLAQRLQEAGHRVVLIGSPWAEQELGVPNVYCDHEEGGELVVRHLLELGHLRFVFQGVWDRENNPRWRGARRVLSETGLEAHARFVGADDDTLQEWTKNPDAVCDYFSAPDAPTALVAWNDHDAVQLLTLLQRAGLRVPEDVSLVGYDNLPQSAVVSPALTTVDSSIERQVKAALRILTRTNSPSAHCTSVVVPSLVRRDSSAPLSA